MRQSNLYGNIQQIIRERIQYLRTIQNINDDFGLAMSLVGKDGWRAKLKLRDEMYKGNDPEVKKRVLQNRTTG